MISLSFCMGALITSNLALTAGHCLDSTFHQNTERDLALVHVEAPAGSQIYSITCEPFYRGRGYFVGDEEITILMRMPMFGGSGLGYLVDRRFAPGESGTPITTEEGKLIALAHGWKHNNGIITKIC